MIGRGLLYNPFLAKEIKQNQAINTEEKRIAFQKFHRALIEQYEAQLSGPGHLLIKMLTYWEYFSYLFINQHRIYKELKKCRSIIDFERKAERVMELEVFLGQKDKQ